MNTIENLYKEISRRPLSELGKPFEVSFDDWIELRELMRSRRELENKPFVSATLCDKPNFLIAGTPVIVGYRS